MVFILIGLISKNKSTLNNAFLAAAFSIGVEVAKFYHAPWIDEFRYTMVGGLILGYVFSFYNILFYITGIAIGMAGERLWLNNADKE